MDDRLISQKNRLQEATRKQPTADVVQLSFEFALKLVKIIDVIPRTTAGYELGRQVIRSGTSIGANVEEAQGARTRPQFINSINIAKRASGLKSF